MRAIQVGTMFAEIKKLLSEIRDAVRRQDAPAPASAAHTFKGVAANSFAKAAFDAALALEMMSKSGDLTVRFNDRTSNSGGDPPDAPAGGIESDGNSAPLLGFGSRGFHRSRTNGQARPYLFRAPHACGRLEPELGSAFRAPTGRHG